MFTVRQVITVAAAAFMSAAPVSIDRSPEGGISLSLDSAQAVVKTRQTVADAAAIAPRAGEGFVYCKDVIGAPAGSPMRCVVGESPGPSSLGPMPPPSPVPAWATQGFGANGYPQPPFR